MSTDYGPRRGFRPQILIALALVAFAVIRYFMQVSTNPVTGERQHVTMTAQQEIALGQETAPQMVRQMGGEIPQDDPRAQLVRQMGRKLYEGSSASKSQYQFRFHLLEDPKTINAFALPGGQIFITEGLLSKLQNEAQLAGVLGHEMGHVIHRHSAQQMAKSQLGGMIASAAGVAASDDRGNGQNAAMIAAAANQMLQLRYGRQDESQSDMYGLEAMTNIGYDPREMAGVMRILAETSGGGRGPEFMQSHPNPEHRAEQIDQWVKEQWPNGVPSNLTKGRSLH